MATGLARLVFLDCKMVPKKSYHKQNEPNCLLHTMVKGVWVTKIQAYSLLQMFGSDACYFRVMSMLTILSGMCTYSIGIISRSSANVLTYCILLLNLELIKGRVTARIVLINHDGWTIMNDFKFFLNRRSIIW